MEFISKYAKHVLTMDPADRAKNRKGKRVEFHEGRFSTTDKATIAFLKEHPAYGVDFTVVDTPKAVAPAPTKEEE